MNLINRNSRKINLSPFSIVLIVGLLTLNLSLASDRIQSVDEQKNWQSRFTFEGQVRPGPYSKDPHVWIYTKEFAKRFGLPDKWINNELKGIAAAAWRKTKTGYVTCGWGGKKHMCKEEDAEVLELYFDTSKVKLNWAPWSKDVDQLSIGPGVSSLAFLTSQKCEHRRPRTKFPNLYEDKGPCWIYGVRQQPFADPDNGKEIFLFTKVASSKRQGNYTHIVAYDKSAYPNLAWLQIAYMKGGSQSSSAKAALFSFETRTAPLGKTIKKFHEFYLPKDFERRIKVVVDAGIEASRNFYKKALRKGDRFIF